MDDKRLDLAAIQAVREIVNRTDSRVPVTDVVTQAAEIERAMNQEIVFARLCTAFGFLALAIASIGLYAALSYHIARRTGEIGIRIALGARRSHVIRMVLCDVMILARLGLALGVSIAMVSSQFVESLLFGMPPKDAPTIGIAVAVVLGAMLSAGLVPATRASRTDPMTALRLE